MLERLNREIKRRTRVATLFPNEASLLRLATAVLMETDEKWQTENDATKEEPVARPQKSILQKRGCTIIVSNSGKCVVTVSEWADYEVLPLVFYSNAGQLINAYGRLEQLLPDNDIDFFASFSGRHWLEKAVLFYGPHDASFIVRLKSGKSIVFDTEHGQVIDDKWMKAWQAFPDVTREWGAAKANVKALTIVHALKLSASKDEGMSASGDFVLSQETGQSSAAILDDIAHGRGAISTSDNSDGRSTDEIRKAAIRALARLKDSPIPQKRVGGKKGSYKGVGIALLASVNSPPFFPRRQRRRLV